MKNNYIVTAILVILVGIAAFYGGIHYQKSQRVAGFGGQGQLGGRTQGQGGNFIRGGTAANGGMVMGEVISQDDTSVTVTLQDGSSKIVILSANTSINKQASGTKDDLKAGERVAIFGKTNSDGSVTAQSIQLNPQMRIRMDVTPTP